MVRIVETIPVDHATKAVLLGATSQLRPLYDLMLARESGDWAATGTCPPTRIERKRSRRSLLASHAVGQTNQLRLIT